MWLARTLDELSAGMRAAFRRYIPGTDTGLKGNFVTVIGKVVASLAHEFELRMAWLTSQMFLSTATGTWLELHCSEIGIYRKQASTASGVISGTGLADTTYAAGIRFYSGGVTYLSTDEVTTDGMGAVSIAVTAETKGAVGNRDADATLVLADPALWQGLSTTFAVDDDGLGGGADKESDDSLRARGLQRKRNPPKGGSLSDYERIVLGVSGVLKAWAFRDLSQPGFVVVLFLFDGRADYIPLTSDVEAVQAAIDATRLIRADDSVAAAPVALPVDIAINGLSRDDSTVRAAIAASVSAMFLARCRPGLTSDTFTVSLSWIDEAISGATGEDRHVLASPVADITLTGGQFPTLGDITYGA
jgi:uncharacterized phage protein gp47/JayE